MAYQIPLFDLHYGKAEEKAILKVLREKWISMGPLTSEFEHVFARHLNVQHVVAVSSCTAALHLAMLVLGVGESDEVIVPSFTFVATVNAIRYARATPVFADIKSLDDLSLDPNEVARKVTPRTKAVIVMHYAGFAADMDPIMKIAEKNGIRVVEDAAHAPDAEYKGAKLGTIGDIGCFSFFANKNITCATGGAFVTNSSGYAERARLLRSHGMTSLSYDRAKGHADDYDVVDLGYNYRIDDIRAALLLAQMRRLKKDVDRRCSLVEEYRRLLLDTEAIIVPYRDHLHYKSSYYIMPCILDSTKTNIHRDELRKRLKASGIQTSVHYPPAHRFMIYKDFPSSLPITEYAGLHEITLPLYYRLSYADVRKICGTLRRALR